MKTEQIPYFTEYSELRKDPEVNAKRISELENILVEMNRGLIFCVSRMYPILRYYPKETEVVGYAAILDALRDYDPSLASFSVHACNQLRASWSLQHLARFYLGGPLHLPHNAYSNYKRDRKVLNELVENGAELTEAQSETLATIEAMDAALNGVGSIHGDPNGDGGYETKLVQDTFDSPQFECESMEHATIFQSAVDSLPDRERHVVIHLFGLETGVPKSLMALGEEMNMSHENVRKIKMKALAKLKKMKLLASIA